MLVRSVRYVVNVEATGFSIAPDALTVDVAEDVLNHTVAALIGRAPLLQG